MSFVEPVFLLLLGLTLAVYWTVKSATARRDTLLAASLVFYGWWDVRFLLLLAVVVLISWFAARQAARFKRGSNGRRQWTVFGIVTNLSILILFKYLGFFSDSAATALSKIGFEASWPTLNLIVPLGVSFYVLQSISYLVDAARKDVPADPSLRRVAFYITFFPQLAAGPIVRAKHFFPQMDKPKQWNRHIALVGLRAVLIGFVYKACLADTFAVYVDPVYGAGSLSDWSNWALVGATVAFGAQVYFDFAGYSLMAVGVARWFGYLLPKNFDYPYASLSIADFWRRWHMSLSAWLRDYVYIPLGGDRHGPTTTFRNAVLTIFLGALWHGAAWTFVAWGLLHGLAVAVHRLFFRDAGVVVPAIVGLIATQGFVLFAWVLFRAESAPDALTIWQAFLGEREGGPQDLHWTAWLAPAFVAADALFGKGEWATAGRGPVLRSPVVYWSGLGALTALILAFYPLDALPFVYFQF